MPFLALAVVIYALMGSGRGITGVAMNTSLMEQVPQHFMGRVQNTFYAAGTALQVLQSYLVGAVAQANLIAGFSVIGLVYAIGFVSATWPVRTAVLDEVFQSRRWATNRRVRKALAQNPYSPPSLAVAALAILTAPDLREIAEDATLSSDVRVQARLLLAHRTGAAAE